MHSETEFSVVIHTPERLPKLKFQSRLNAVGSFSEGPEKFFIQLASNRDLLESLSLRLNDLCEKLDSEDFIPMTLDVGEIIAAHYINGDSLWYRAEVIEKLDEGRIKVFYIDYGNEDIVDEAETKVLDRRFFLIPPQAIRCRLLDCTDLEPRLQFFIDETEGQELIVDVLGFDAGTLKVNVTITKNDIIYNIRNFLQLRSGQTISCPPVHQTVNISADLNSHDGDIKSLRRIVEPQNLPMSVAKRNFERNQMSDGINSNRTIESAHSSSLVEELSVTPFDTSRLRKHLGQPSNVGESEKTKRTSISEVINTMQIHRSSQSMTCGGMLTSNINLRRPDLNSPIKIGTVFYSNQHNESTLPIDITAKLSTQLEESKPPSGFLPTASIIENQDNVSNESRRDRSPYVDCVPQGSSLSGNTFLGATMSSDSSHENNRQTPAIAPGSLSCIVQMDQYSHLVHKRIPSRVLELVGAWHKKNPVSILTEYGTVRKMKIIFDLVSEAGPPGDILYQYQANVGGKPYGERGVAHSKKEAKINSAVAALDQLIEEGYISNNHF